MLRNPARISRIVPSPEDLREAAQVIAQSRLPLIYAGGGVARSDAKEALIKLAEVTNIPVVTSSGGKGTIPDNHPLSYGSCFSPRGEMQEMNQLYEVMQSADVVIGIGARFSLGNPAGESSTLVNINIDDGELTRIQSNTIPLHGDARATIEALIPYLVEAGAGEHPSPAEAVAAARSLIAYYDIRLREPQYPVMEAMQKGIPEDAFIVSDVTQFGYYARTHYRVNQPKTYIDSGYSFNLGYGFPTALGVKVAKPDRPVLCVTGDGGFMFNASELSTAVKYGINRPVEKAQETKAVVPDSIYNVPVRRCSEAINLLRATHYSYRQLTYRAPSPYPEAIAARSLMTAGPGGPIPPSLRTAFEKLCASADM